VHTERLVLSLDITILIIIQELLEVFSEHVVLLTRRLFRGPKKMGSLLDLLPLVPRAIPLQFLLLVLLGRRLLLLLLLFVVEVVVRCSLLWLFAAPLPSRLEEAVVVVKDK
jgi:hypothetical protein